MRVVICDDHKVFGEAMASVLTGHGYDVVACTDGPPSGLAAVTGHRPDLYLVDLHFRGVDGIDGLSGIGDVRAASPDTRVIVVSGSCDPEAAARARAAGAEGFVAKDRPLEDIISAIATVAAGGSVFHDPATGLASPARRSSQRRPASRTRVLTGREREILDRLVQGQGTAALARDLGVTYSTARTHIQRLLAKLGVHSKLEAVALVTREAGSSS